MELVATSRNAATRTAKAARQNLCEPGRAFGWGSSGRFTAGPSEMLGTSDARSREDRPLRWLRPWSTLRKLPAHYLATYRCARPTQMPLLASTDGALGPESSSAPRRTKGPSVRLVRERLLASCSTRGALATASQEHAAQDE